MGRHPGRASSSTPRASSARSADDLLYHGDLNAALRRALQSGMRAPGRAPASKGSASCWSASPAAAGRSWSATSCRASAADIARRLDEVVDQRAGRPSTAGDLDPDEAQAPPPAARRAAARPGRPVPGALQQYDFADNEARRRFEELTRRAAPPAPPEPVQPDGPGDGRHVPRADGGPQGHAGRAQPDAGRPGSGARSPTSPASWSATASSSPATRRASTSCWSRWPARWPRCRRCCRRCPRSSAASSRSWPRSCSATSTSPGRWTTWPATSRAPSRDLGWDRGYDFSGADPLDLAGAPGLLERLGDLDELEHLLRSATSPGPAGRSRPRPGPGAPRRRRRRQPRAARPAWPGCWRRPA